MHGAERVKEKKGSYQAKTSLTVKIFFYGQTLVYFNFALSTFEQWWEFIEPFWVSTLPSHLDHSFTLFTLFKPAQNGVIFRDMALNGPK